MFEEIRNRLRRQPFEPFRVRMADGTIYEVRHPEFASVARRSLHVAVPQGTEEADHHVDLNLATVTAIEPLDPTAPGSSS